VTPETQFVFNTLSFLMSGFLVMWMAAGFTMLEAGLVRKRSVGTQLLKNIALYSTAGILYYLIGYNLMYSGVDGGFFGTLAVWSADDTAALAGQGADFSAGYAASSDWFFRMVFVATAASIVSGSLAERVRVWPFLLFIVVLTGIIYPITGSWQWGGGWLSEMGFSDFAGSTLVHSVGGWAALAGLILLGARKGKYGPGGKVNPMLGSSCRSPRSAPSFSGSDGSASTAAPSSRSAAPRMPSRSPTSTSTPISPPRAAWSRRWC
jgi:Amt family ammonium transporter